MRHRAGLVLALAITVTAAACGGDRVVVAAGTTVVDGGLLDAVVERYEAATGTPVAVTGAATREVLALGERGGADFLVTHAPAQEAEFLVRHPEAVSSRVFASRFLLVGPPERAAGLVGLDPPGAFATIAERGWTFVTRADGSGTHDKELEIWALAGIEPAGSWLLSTGQGMGLSLQVADQRSGFILVEEGTFLVAQPTVSLVPVEWADDGALTANPYTAIAPSGDGAAADLLAWMTGPEGVAAITAANVAAYGRLVYVP